MSNDTVQKKHITAITKVIKVITIADFILPIASSRLTHKLSPKEALRQKKIFTLSIIYELCAPVKPKRAAI